MGDYPVRWGPQENVAWKAKLPGPGASSPVVHRDGVFITCFTGNKAPEIVRRLLCFERTTGKRRGNSNSTSSPARPTTPVNCFSTVSPRQRPSLTATVSMSIIAGAVSFASTRLARKSVRPVGNLPQFVRSGSSPSIHGNLLLVNATIEAGALFALERTGDTVWCAKLAGDSWAVPVVVQTEKGTVEIVQNSQDGLFGSLFLKPASSSGTVPRSAVMSAVLRWCARRCST